MKNIIALFALILMFSCEPIEDRDTLVSGLSADEIEVEAIQKTPGSNNITLIMKTPGVEGYWEYGIGKSFSNKVEFNYHLPETATFKYVVSRPHFEGDALADAEFIEKKISVTVTKLDHHSGPYSTLAGTTLAGKTWKFDKSVPELGDPTISGTPAWGGWWYQAHLDPKKWEEPSWPYGNSSDVDGRMVFNLNGGANYIYYESPEAEGIEASFSFNSDLTRVLFTHRILGEEGGANTERNPGFTVMRLTEDEMILFGEGVRKWGDPIDVACVMRFRAVD